MTITLAQAASALQARTDRSGACAEFCHEVAMAFGNATPRVYGPTAYNVGAASHFDPNTDYSHAKSAPPNSWHWFKQKPGHAIMGYAPPEPGHVMFDPAGGGSDALSITSFPYGPLIAGTKFLRHGSVGQYLALNPQVEYWGWTVDYAGCMITLPGNERLSRIGKVNVRSTPEVTPANIVGVFAGTSPATFTGFVHGQSVTVSGVTSDIWFIGGNDGKGDAYFAAACFVDVGTHDLTEVRVPIAPVVAPPVVPPPPVIIPPVVPVEPVDHGPTITPANPNIDYQPPVTPATTSGLFSSLLAALVSLFGRKH